MPVAHAGATVRKNGLAVSHEHACRIFVLSEESLISKDFLHDANPDFISSSHVYTGIEASSG